MNNYFTLQLMAAANTNVTTDSGLSYENKTYYDMNLLREATPKLVHAQFGQKRPIPKNGGKTIEFRKYGSLPKALTALTEGVTPDGQKMEVTNVEATVSQYGSYLTLSDVLELTAIDNNIVEATRVEGNQAGLTLDTLSRNAMNAGNNVMYCDDTATGGTITSRKALTADCVLTVDMVKRAVTALKAQNTPTINGDYVAIIHPYMSYELTKDPEWKEWHKYTDAEAMYAGEIGKIAGCRFVETTEALILKDSTCPSGLAVFSTLILGDGAYGVTEVTGGGLQTIIKQKGSAGTADPLDQRSTVGWKALSVTKILMPKYMIRVEGCSKSYSATAAAN